MSSTNNYRLFASVLFRIIKNVENLDSITLSRQLGYKTGAMVGLWLTGKTLPPITQLASIANALQVPLEDVLVPWLADQDQEHVERYTIIAAQLMGREAADDLLSGAQESGDKPWWASDREGLTSAEVVVEMKNPPPGIYRLDPGPTESCP